MSPTTPVTAMAGITRRALPWLLAAGVLAGVGVVVWAFWPRHTPVPPKEQATLDSLRGTSPDFRARVDTLVQHETTYVAQSRHDRAGSIETARRADSLRALAIAADSAARAARDTSSLWERAANIWHATADTLRAANGQLARAYSAESTARAAADARAGEYERRLTATTDLNTRLAADLRRADPPCRILLVARCPSRKVVAVLGLGAGYLVSRADVRRAATRAVHDGLQLVLP